MIPLSDESLKQQLADAILMLEQAGIFDCNGHFSMRVPDSDYIWINSGASIRSALTVSDIVMIDLEGKLMEGSAPPPMECHLHTEIYKKRHDVGAIAHPHPKWSTLFTIAGVPIEIVMNQAAVLGEIQYFPTSLSVNTPEMGNRVANTLGAHRIALLRSHGAVIAAEGIMETFALACYLEDNAERQYLASQLGAVNPLTAEERETMAGHLWKPNLLRKVWDYEYAKLKRSV
ncbi:class II aldolase/adducin family protein [Paenibacillus abyssi]|uniref:Aldolase class 2 protein n=1 Tax=Paenibacillus abyssi TaxID=1340531 RepID=A0A917FR20_9BACL|nr:class II aldolase/adducin family protein [Paenibacillus abyssi]GGG00941.1 putative aldolase class 2 protein [Paenibacillus abyssi]